MIHHARNPTMPLPIDVMMFDGFDPVPGQAPNMLTKVMCLDNGYTLDADGVFRQQPSMPYLTMSAFSQYSHIYRCTLQPHTWPRGHYRALVRHNTGQEWATEFTVGLYVDRRLNYSAVYDGEALSLSVWVEDNGDVQTDFQALTEVKILNANGTTIATLPNALSPNEGIFHVTGTIPLAAGQNFIFDCKAVAPGPDGLNPFTFSLRIGFARP